MLSVGETGQHLQTCLTDRTGESYLLQVVEARDTANQTTRPTQSPQQRINKH